MGFQIHNDRSVGPTTPKSKVIQANFGKCFWLGKRGCPLAHEMRNETASFPRQGRRKVRETRSLRALACWGRIRSRRAGVQ